MKQNRIVALDWMRGIIIVLMAIGHSCLAFYPGWLVKDSFYMYKSGMILPPGPFFLRWITHVAPVAFFFLAGAAIALSKKTVSDSDLFKRGLILIAIEIFFINLFWGKGVLLLQVMWALGTCFWLMIPLRKVKMRTVFILSLALIIVPEFFFAESLRIAEFSGSVISGFLLTGVIFKKIHVLYPTLVWLPAMTLGWIFGQQVLTKGVPATNKNIFSLFGLSAFFLFALFLLIRVLNAYGNMKLLAYDNSIVQLLFVSKYPPSIAFYALETSIMLFMLGILFSIQVRVKSVWIDNPILVFGQTPLFFYITHIFLFETFAKIAELNKKLNFASTMGVCLFGLIILYPLCCRYREMKFSKRHTFLKYL